MSRVEATLVHFSAPATATAFDANVLQAETIAQSAERGGKKVLQLEWAGGRSGVIDGPTVDYRTFHSGRGVTTNFIDPTDQERLIASFGLQFDHPAGFAGNAPFPQAAPTDATGGSAVRVEASAAMPGSVGAKPGAAAPRATTRSGSVGTVPAAAA